MHVALQKGVTSVAGDIFDFFVGYVTQIDPIFKLLSASDPDGRSAFSLVLAALTMVLVRKGGHKLHRLICSVLDGSSHVIPQRKLSSMQMSGPANLHIT
jgi:hypothetical protein